MGECPQAKGSSCCQLTFLHPVGLCGYSTMGLFQEWVTGLGLMRYGLR